MKTSAEPSVAALLRAAKTGGLRAATEVWLAMTEPAKEAAVANLVAMLDDESEVGAGVAVAVGSQQRDGEQSREEIFDSPDPTEQIPKIVEDLRGLTGSETDQVDGPLVQPEPTFDSTAYWSRWRRRWKWSVLVALWVMASISAFNGGFDSFGLTEWMASMLMSVVGSGLLIGTLANFAIAALPSRIAAHVETL